METRPRNRLIMIGLLSVYLILLIYLASTSAPSADEYGHLASGVQYWLTGRTDAYRVNPPLVRAIATFPLSFSPPSINYDIAPAQRLYRSEAVLASELLLKYKQQIMPYMIVARLCCIPFALLGALICYRWAEELGGASAGFAAMLLWMCDPNLLMNATLIIPDVGPTALGVALWYLFSHWLADPTSNRTVLLGIALGATLLSKFTMLIFVPLIPLIYLLHAILSGDRIQAIFIGLGKIAIAMAIALVLIGGVYGFAGFGNSLREYSVTSSKFYDLKDSFLGGFPIPLPADFVLGIDRQALDFQYKPRSYLNGIWQDGGWYYYYVEALLIKSPIALVPLLLISVWNVRSIRRTELLRFMPVVVPGIAIFAVVSLNTGFNRHLRYVLPALPFLFVFTSMAVMSIRGLSLKIPQARIGWILVSLFCIESLWCLPHPVSFFNVAVGGPAAGPSYLGHTNIDWGQDLMRYQKWRRSHPEINIVGASLDLPSIFIDGPPTASLPEYASQLRPGWYAIGVSRLIEENECCEFFRTQEPIDTIGYTIAIFHVTPSQVDSLIAEARRL